MVGVLSGSGTLPGMNEGRRVLQLDAIRGGLAVGVMTFHVAAWSGVGLVTTLGTYWVYAFFVLSGFALEHVYGARLTSIGAIGAFARARVSRIAPLFVAATLLTVAAAVAGGRRVDAVQVGANITGLFGLWQPGATQVAEGAWSIGIELVFYAIFPIVVALRLGTRALAGLALGALLLRLAWVEAVWPDGANFGRTWDAYTVVPSFLVFFVVGMLAARLAARGSRRASHVPFLVGSCLLLLVLGASALPVEQRDFFAGPLSIALVAATCLGVGVAAFGAPWQGPAARLATLMGDASYATYLLHPLVWGVLALAGLGVATLVVTPLLALAVHRWFERPAQRLIRSFGARGPVPQPVTAGTSSP
jgi:exopolysaccharide production protein ExoZ